MAYQTSWMEDGERARTESRRRMASDQLQPRRRRASSPRSRSRSGFRVSGGGVLTMGRAAATVALVTAGGVLASEEEGRAGGGVSSCGSKRERERSWGVRATGSGLERS